MNRTALRYLIAILSLAAFLAGATGLPGVAAAGAEQQPIFRTVSVEEAAAMMTSRQDMQIIDVRTPQERRQFRIADTLLVPVGDIIRGVFEADPRQPLMLVCAVGGRSYIAGKVMFARGYREIYNLEGGLESWRRAGLPLETGPEERDGEAYRTGIK